MRTSTARTHRAGRAAKRQPGPVHLNSVLRAIEGARKLPPADVDRVKRGLEESLLQFGRGIDCQMHLKCMADAINVAEALAELRICSDDTSRGCIQAGQQVLATVLERHAERRTWTLHAQERQALDDALWLHGVQLDHCSLREYEQALQRVRNVARAALTGSVGPGVMVLGAIGLDD